MNLSFFSQKLTYLNETSEYSEVNFNWNYMQHGEKHLPSAGILID